MITFLTAGESHGPQLTAILDGFPAGFHVDPDKIQFQMDRRRKGYGRGGRMKIENDRVEIVSGVRHGLTLGSPITLVIKNNDWENWSEIMDPLKLPPEDLGLRERRLAEETTCPRPGHADLAGGIKYNHHDLRNVLERASARETAARTAVGALARQLLESFGVEFASHVIRIGQAAVAKPYTIESLKWLRETTEKSEVRCLDEDAGNQMIEEIKKAKNSRDSLGGIAELIVRGVPVGLGSYSQWSDRLDARLAAALMSIPSVKGVEFGLGFQGGSMYGSEVHDEIRYQSGTAPARKGFHRVTNHAGGIEGGISNGEDIIARVAAKPLSTLNRPLKTVDVVSKKSAEAMVERTDHCVVPALAVVGEAMAAITIAQAFMEKFGGDNFDELSRNYRIWLDTAY
jgi:chorismate synthase